MRLTLARKMLLGNLTLVLLILIVGLSALASLKALHALGTNLVQVDLPNFELTAQLMESFSAEDQYEERYIHLGDPALQALADEQREKFGATLQRFRALPPNASREVERIGDLHAEYRRVAFQARAALEHGDDTLARVLISDSLPHPRQRLTVAIQSPRGDRIIRSRIPVFGMFPMAGPSTQSTCGRLIPPSGRWGYRRAGSNYPGSQLPG